LVYALFTNEIFIVTIISFAICQLVKTITGFIAKKKFDVSLLMATGGMPSSHTSTVTALTLGVGFSQGFASPLFVVTLFISLIVIRDALGVRRTVDSLIKYTNKLIKGKKLGLKQITKIAGHTPLQVFGGLLLGVVVTLIIHYVWWI
jgi:uncharacterized protein